MKKGFEKVFSCAMAFIFAFGMTPTLPTAMADEAKQDVVEQGAIKDGTTTKDQTALNNEASEGDAAALDKASEQEATLQTTTLTDGTYSVDVASSMGMLTPMTGDEASYIVVKENKAYVVFNATTSPDKNGAVKYDALYRGKVSEAPADAASADCVVGIPIYAPEGSTSYTYGGNTYTWSDGTGVVYGYTYVLDFDKDTLISKLDDTSNEDIDFTMRYTSHYMNSSGSSASASKWSGSNDQYLTLSNVVRTSDSTDVPSADDSGDNEPVETFYVNFQYSRPNTNPGSAGLVCDFTDAVITVVDETNKSYSVDTSSGLGKVTVPKGHTYTMTMSKEGCAEIVQGEWDVEKHNYIYTFTGNDKTVLTFTEEDAGKNLHGYYAPIPQAADDLKKALAMVPTNTGIFTDSTAAALKTAVDNADTTCLEEDKLAEMTQNVLNALTNLVPKDGTYSASITLVGKQMFKPSTGTLTVKNGKMTYNGLTPTDTYTKYYKPSVMYSDGIITDEQVTEYVATAKQEAQDAETAGDTTNMVYGTKRTDAAQGYSFDIPVQKLDSTIVVGAYSSTRNSWNSTGCFYIDAASLEQIPETLTITNNTAMFKGEKAQLFYDKEGNTNLRLTLSGSTYHYLVKGTYEQAVQIGDDTSKWIAGALDENSKYYFDIPIKDGETKIPLVSVSSTYYDKYTQGLNTVERSFYARQAELDVDNLTLTIGDYSSTEDCTLANYGTDIANGTDASIDVVGCINSNTYKYAVSFKLASKYDKVFVGNKTNAAQAAASSLISPAADGTITLDPKDDGSGHDGAKSTMSSGVGTTISVRNASDQTWTEYVVTPDLLDNTVSLDKLSTIDDVKALIEKLPSFEQVTAENETQIRTAERAYNALTTAEQAQLDTQSATKYAYDTMQPYGRVLETAVWALEALNPVNNETSLAEGIYNANSELTSEYSKGKSTSPRERPWSVKSISVDADGNATAAVTVESTGYTYIRFGGKTYYNQAVDGENSVFYVPIKPNSKLYFGAYSTSMRCEIAFTLDNTLPDTATPIDGSALAAAIEEAVTTYDAANISDDGSEFKIGDKYVPTTEAAKLDTAIKQAKSVLYGNTSTKENMDAVVTTLQAAVAAFNAAYVDVKDLGWERISGQQREDTAAAIATKGWSSSKTAIIASATNYPDALCASAVAGNYDCPLLLVFKDDLPSATTKALVSLGVENVIVMGGDGAISDTVVSEIEKLGIDAERVSGETREETSIKAMEKVTSLNDSYDTVVISYGYNFPDALSISPYSYVASAPILLTQGDGTLKDSVVSAIKSNSNVKNVVIVGGSAVVSDTVKDQLGSGYTYNRLAGQTRFETSQKIAEFELAATDADGNKLFNSSNSALAYSENFPDALSGGAFCGHRQSILMIANDSNYDIAISTLNSQKSSRVLGVVFGGEGVISKDLYNLVEEGTK